MASESVRVIIDAEDNASAKFRKLAESAASSSAAMKVLGDTGRSLANTFGNLGGVMGDIPFQKIMGHIDRANIGLQEFNRLQKLGKGFSVGKAVAIAQAAKEAYDAGFAVGQWLVGAKALNEEFEKSLETLRKITTETITSGQKRFDEAKAMLQFKKEGAERDAAAMDMAKALTAEMKNRAKSIIKAEAAIEAYGNSSEAVAGRGAKIIEAQKEEVKQGNRINKILSKRLLDITVVFEREKEIAKVKKAFTDNAANEKTEADLAHQKELLDVTLKYAKIKRDLIDSGKEGLSTSQKDQQTLEKNFILAGRIAKGEDAFIKARIGTAMAEREIALRISNEQDKAQAKRIAQAKELAEVKEVAMKAEERRAERDRKSRDQVLISLRLQTVAITESATAAAKRKLENQGFTEDQAERLAKLQVALGASKPKTKSSARAANTAQVIRGGSGRAEVEKADRELEELRKIAAKEEAWKKERRLAAEKLQTATDEILIENRKPKIGSAG